jgi:formate/nitrite transporter
LLKWETILSYSTPAETAELAVESGATKAALPAGKMLVGGFLAGAYIAFGGLLAIVASAGLKPETWGGLVTLVTGLVFSLGLILVVIGGAELLTGNMMLVPLAVLKKRTTLSRLGINWAMLTVGNLVGALFVAYLMADRTGVIGTAASKVGTPAASNFARLSSISIGKALTESDLQIFLRAVGCNWLVCAAVWLALSAKDIGGKILAIVFPITAFVALGFDHVVANMFFLPLAMFQHVPGVTIGHVVSNLVIAFIGNALGASLFVSGAYWYLYLQHAPAAPRAEQRAHQNGRSANVGADSA